VGKGKRQQTTRGKAEATLRSELFRVDGSCGKLFLFLGVLMPPKKEREEQKNSSKEDLNEEKRGRGHMEGRDQSPSVDSE